MFHDVTNTSGAQAIRPLHPKLQGRLIRLHWRASTHKVVCRHQFYCPLLCTCTQDSILKFHNNHRFWFLLGNAPFSVRMHAALAKFGTIDSVNSFAFSFVFFWRSSGDANPSARAVPVVHLPLVGEARVTRPMGHTCHCCSLNAKSRATFCDTTAWHRRSCFLRFMCVICWCGGSQQSLGTLAFAFSICMVDFIVLTVRCCCSFDKRGSAIQLAGRNRV